MDRTSLPAMVHIEDINALRERERKLRELRRNDWFAESLKQLTDCDVIFCNPDNGIETKSLSKSEKDSAKYVYIREIIL